MNIDQTLGGISRPFGRKEGTWSFGPTGRRLWATYIDSSPGFSGLFDYIHKTNIPALFHLSVLVDGNPVSLHPGNHIWYPSRTEAAFRSSDVELRETKFITDDDCAVDVVRLINLSQRERKIELMIDWPEGKDWDYEWRGFKVYVRGAASGQMSRILKPGERATITVASAFGLSPIEADRTLNQWIHAQRPAESHRENYQNWFDKCPEFRCSEAQYEKLWAYRWYLLRRNISHPGTGLLKHPVIYEGRGYKMTFDPWEPRGWEFSKLIPFSTPFHLLEGRWHPDTDACKGSVLALAENQLENGLFPFVYTDGVGTFYTNFLAWAVWQFYLVQPDKDWLEAVAPALQKELDGTLSLFDPDNDGLPEVHDHNRTGKEYQPSFFYKAGYPEEAKQEYITSLERVDYASYVYLNAFGLSKIWSILGNNAQAEKCKTTARRIKESILSLMWSQQDNFFYDVDSTTHERIPVKQVVGYDPFFAGVAGIEHIRAFSYLTNPKIFGVPYPVSSVEAGCPAYAPDAKWMGNHVKGPHGAMWNGPTWPFTNSTVLMALANATRMSGHRFDPLYREIFHANSELVFRDGEPNIFEHYNPETGEPISQEEDYFHSSWIDLVVSHIAGVIPHEGEPSYDPIKCRLQDFSLTGLPYKGELLNIRW